MEHSKDLSQDKALIAVGVQTILEGLGLNLADPNFRETPERVAKMYLEMFAGLGQEKEVEKILSIRFPSTYSGIIVHRNLQAFSSCPHHLSHVRYEISLAYLAKEVVGLSKIPRAVELLAKRPVLQETLTEDIANAIEKNLKASAVLVIVKGEHSCMRVRGVKSQTDEVITSSIRGLFEEDKAARSEALSLLQN